MQPSGKSVDCAYGDTVLMALEKAPGYALPNNCRAGACGECKVKVTTGQFDQGMVLDMALSQEERKQGYGLMCMAKPISEELVIEWGTEDAKPKLFPPREMPCSLLPTIARSPPVIVELRCARLASRCATGPGSTSCSAIRAPQVPPRAYSIWPMHRVRMANGAASGPCRRRRHQQLDTRRA
jgi:CDP-4-dehydro-6-deoxyglucose reductase